MLMLKSNDESVKTYVVLQAFVWSKSYKCSTYVPMYVTSLSITVSLFLLTSWIFLFVLCVLMHMCLCICRCLMCVVSVYVVCVCVCGGLCLIMHVRVYVGMGEVRRSSSVIWCTLFSRVLRVDESKRVCVCVYKRGLGPCVGVGEGAR